MEKNDVIINSRGIRQRSPHYSEYRRKRSSSRESSREKPNKITMSDLIVIRIIFCIIIGSISCIFLNSHSEGSEKLKTKLDTLLTENISTDDLTKFKDNIINIKDKGISTFNFNNGEEIDSDYIEKMNEEDVFYKNQKK